ncbi:unnamed protein product [Somion occarium]|uniref:Uncharacterized protein n=1 Tax=Somion occarium TaxID=3059160 RepID=A0ABP1E1S3_9APHY
MPDDPSNAASNKQSDSYNEKTSSNHAASEPSLSTGNPPERPMIAYHDDTGPPPLDYTLRTRPRERYIALFFGLLFLEAGVLPLILFYSLRWGAHLSITKNLAIITSLIGTVSGFKVAQRTYLLWFRNEHESRRPIGASRWGLDFFHILINIGLAAFFVPLIVGSSLSPASVATVAMALPCFMLSICLPMLISGLFPSHFRLPFRVSSFPPHHLLPPLTYTIVEDVIAVDGSGKIEFRQAWRYRYEESRIMRKLLRDLALYWGITGTALGVGLIVVAWLASDDVGYGLGYGMPWLWAFVSTPLTILWVRRELGRERREWGDLVNVHLEKPMHLVETRVDREAYERMMARRSSLTIRRGRDNDLAQVGDGPVTRTRTLDESHRAERENVQPVGRRRCVSEKQPASGDGWLRRESAGDSEQQQGREHGREPV